MWLSNRAQREEREEAAVQTGMVTIAGDPAGVYLAGERRNVALFSPGGYHWVPDQQDTVLIVKSGEEQAFQLLGRKNPKTELELKPGEVWISVVPQSGIHLRKDGIIDLIGEIYHNGQPLAPAEPEEEEVL